MPMPPTIGRKRPALVARPLLAAGAGLVAAIVGGACGGSPVGNLKSPPACDAGYCLPDGGLPADAGTYCICPDAGS